MINSRATQSQPDYTNEGKKSVPFGIILYCLYGFTRQNRLRNLIRKLLFHLEGGMFYSVTLRKIFKKYHDVEIGMYPYAINGLAMVRNEVDGAVKIVSDARYGEILGVHAVGSNATEIIGEAVTAMQLEATVQELARSIRVHPTFSEAMVDAARDAGSWALYLPRG